MKNINVKDLVLETLSDFSLIKTSADNGDAESCFKMGMIYLMGINTKVSFNKAGQYFNNQSLSGDHDVILLLGFIEECKCNYSHAFQLYAQNEGSEKDSYIDKVIKGRNHLQDLLKKLGLPFSLNKEISSILSHYGKGKSSKTGACVKIAAICDDEQTCIEAAKCLFDSKDFISSIDWLKRGNVGTDDSMYKTINEKLSKNSLDLLSSKDLQVINIETNSLLSREDPTPFFKKVKNTCNEASMKCSEEWKEKNKTFIDKLIKEQKEQAYLASLAEEEEAKRKKTGRIFLIGIVIIIIWGILMMLIPSSSERKTKEVTPEKIEELDSLETNNTEEEENILSEEYLRKYLDEVIPVAMKMNEEEAVKKYFSKEFNSLYFKVDKYDKENIGEGELGFWDFDFWTGGQEDNRLQSVSVLKISDFSNKEATAIIQFYYKIGEYDESKFSETFKMVFDNEKWLIDDFNSYKFRFEEYLKEVGKNTSSVDDNQYINRLINNLSEVRLSEADLADLSNKDMEILRNSIYARYGYRFNRSDLLEYFSRYSWYSPTTNDMESIYNRMNDLEKYNIEFIKKHE